MLLPVAVGALVLVAVCSSALAASRGRPARDVVTLTRDSAGIPHIRAGKFQGLGFGDGYALAQDNLCTLADQFITVEGQRSRYFGLNAMNLNCSA